MLKRLAVLSVLLIAGMGPAAAERLRFEGQFTTQQDCGSLVCDDPVVAIAPVPYAFTVELLPGRINHSFSEAATSRFAPPRYAPPLALAPYFGPGQLDERRFNALTDPVRRAGELYFTERDGRRFFSWEHIAGQDWGGSSVLDGRPLHEQWAEGLQVRMGRAQDVPNTNTTFADLVAFLDESIATKRTADVIAHASYTTNFLDVEERESQTSRWLTGEFRLVSLECRSSPGALARAGAAMSRLLGS